MGAFFKVDEGVPTVPESLPGEDGSTLTHQQAVNVIQYEQTHALSLQEKEEIEVFVNGLMQKYLYLWW